LSIYADGNFDGSASSLNGLTSDKSFCTIHGNASNSVLSKMLSNFEDKSLTGGRVYGSMEEMMMSHTDDLQSI
jgi:hypothetical protein